jgi:hypothetical protein
VQVVGIALAVATLVGVYWTNVFPTPPSPYDVFPFAFFGLVIVGAAAFAARRRQAPASLTEDDAVEVAAEAT